MGCEVHDIVYYGAVNVYRGEELLKVIEAWKCRKCGGVKVGSRWPGEMSSSDGVLELLEPGERKWLVIVSREGPDAWPLIAKPGDLIRVGSSLAEEDELLVREDYSVVTAQELRVPTSVAVYLLDDVIKGYIDTATWPPTVVTLTAHSR